MVRREIVKKIRDFDRSDLMGSESDFWMQIGSVHPIYGISEPLTYYRRHAQNTSKNLTKSISHFEFLIQKYREYQYINALDFRKMEIIVSMMRAFVDLQNRDFQ